MKKSELVITSSHDEDNLAGYRSRCLTVKFDLQGNALRHKELLWGLFDLHFKRVHKHDAAEFQPEKQNAES